MSNEQVTNNLWSSRVSMLKYYCHIFILKSPVWERYPNASSHCHHNYSTQWSPRRVLNFNMIIIAKLTFYSMSKTWPLKEKWFINFHCKAYFIGANWNVKSYVFWQIQNSKYLVSEWDASSFIQITWFVFNPKPKYMQIWMPIAMVNKVHTAFAW